MDARKYDHDEAYARWQKGESISAIARSLGVSPTSIWSLVERRDPGRRAAHNAWRRDWNRSRYRKPCIRGCGRMSWHHPSASGICARCDAEERVAAALARDNHGTESRYVNKGCHCDACKQAASQARRARKLRAKERSAQAA